MVTCAFSKPKCCALLKEICLNIKSSYIKNNDLSLWYFSLVQSLSHVRLFATPLTAAHEASLSITNSQSPPKPMSIELVIPSNHLILCCPLLLLPLIFPSIMVFSNELALHIRWPKCWRFSLILRSIKILISHNNYKDSTYSKLKNRKLIYFVYIYVYSDYIILTAYI